MKRLFRCLLVALPFVPVFAAEPAPPAKVDGFAFVRTVGAISEYTLESNGLTVLLLPDHSAPVLTFMITYRVGSRNEVTGTTGATHLLEHLMYKGSTRWHRGIGKGYDQTLDPLGALNNGTTWLDRTNYYVESGSDHLPVIVGLEADRVRNLLLREEDRQPEMTVVRNEFERGENDPVRALSVEIGAAAYIAHPYHHSTIGWRSDIEKVSIGKLREFYDTFYWPNNATVTIVGDFQPAQALGLIKQQFGAIPRSPKPIPTVYTEEPAQTFPRRVGVRRAGEVGVVGIAFKTPGARHADYPALTVLASIVTSGKNSRLYRALTDKNLTIDVSGSVGFTHDPSLLSLDLIVAPGVTHEEVEKTALAELEKVKREGVAPAEVQAAVAKQLADSAYQRDGATAIATNLNEAIAVEDWTLYYTLEDALKKVTAADVQRVANRYLQADQSTTGWFVPLAAPAEAAAAPKN